ncbi:hypothetical protein [Candidatus Magnetaquiglobus chichijimensis]
MEIKTPESPWIGQSRFQGFASRTFLEHAGQAAESHQAVRAHEGLCTTF